MSKTIKHKVMVHPTKYSAKPNGQEGMIQNQIFAKENHKELTITELGNEATSGKTFKVGHFIGRNKSDYIENTSSLLVLDVDNKYKVDNVEHYTNYTIDDAIAICESKKLNIALIYTSFNHTDERHKFRLVFQLSRTVSMTEWNHCLDVVKSLVGIAGVDENGIADKQVHNGHYTYGGHNLVLVDESAILDVEWLLKQPLLAKKIGKKTPKSVAAQGVKGKPSITPISNQCKNKHCKDMWVIEESSEKPVIPTVTAQINSEIFANNNKIQVKTDWMALEYAKTLPLNELVGADMKTSCLFHEDNKPSAGFFKADDGAWYYKCFSCGIVCDIVDFVAMAYGLDKQQDFKAVIDKIAEICNIEIIRDTWIQSCHLNFFNNEMYFSKAEKYKAQYPLTSAGMIFADSVYALILREAKMALEYKSAKDLNGAPLVSISRQYITQRTGLSEEKVKSRIQRLLNMSLVRILSDEEVKAVSNDLYEASKVSKNKADKTISTYAVYVIDPQLLDESERRLKHFKESGATTKGATARQSLAVYNGTDNTFAKSKGDSEKVVRDREVLMTWARKEMTRKGYILKDSYLAYAKKKGYGEKYASTFITEMTSKFGLKRAIVNNEHTKKYGLPSTATKKAIFIAK